MGTPSGEKDHLMYFIRDALLTGTVNGRNHQLKAVSGGRAGSKKPGAVDEKLANNPFATSVKMDEFTKSPGGPIPCGRYRSIVHPTRANWLRLEMVEVPGHHGKGPRALLFPAKERRSGFAIHGRGQRGSDGCIVPLDFNQLLALIADVRAAGSASLWVVAGDLSLTPGLTLA
jgi:hypothetical protein